MPPFEFATATRIIFGTGTAQQVPTLAAALTTTDQAILLVHSPSTVSLVDSFQTMLHDLRGSSAPECIRVIVQGEPDMALIEAGVQAARIASGSGCGAVIAIGGGSVIDAGKAISGLLTNGGSVLDYVEVVGRGKALSVPAAPFIAVPTTAGTGAEVTRNAVISIPDQQVKVSLRSPYLLPRVAVVDPELTYSLPPAVTASTGLDTLTQLIEAYTCNRPNPLVDAIAMSGISHVVRGLLPAYRESTPTAREAMAYASLCSGMALANAGLGAVHGFAAVLGGRYPIPHGVCCATLLPYVIRANCVALHREPQNRANARYFAIALTLVPDVQPGPQFELALFDHLRQLCTDLSIPSLAHYGVTADAIPELVNAAQNASSMKANPIRLTPDELSAILTAAL